MSSTVDKIKAKVDNIIHHNQGTNTTSTNSTTHSHSGVSQGTAGSHTSHLGNGANPRVHSDRDGRGTTGHGSGLTGGTVGTGHNNSGVTRGNAGNISSTTGNTTAGPHSSSLANKLDPTVHSTGTNTGSSGHAGNHAGNNHGAYTGTSGGISNSTNAGPHDSNLANKLDPRVDSDLDGRGNRHGAQTGHGIFGASGSHATPGSGTAQNTAGPHHSDMANKLDPRVDSDLDGSATVGANHTRR